MLALIVYVFVALGFSFLCSVAEAVLLSVSRPYIALLQQQGRRTGALLEALKADINSPLAAILTLNTVAHTVGAAGAGAQAAAVFGSAYVGAASAVLTLLILVFSEIIPKTVGALYWRGLAPATAHFLRLLIATLYPFVMLSRAITRGLGQGPTLNGFSREEFSAMAEIGSQEGELAPRESRILKNVFLLSETRVRDVMTPRMVVFALPEALTTGEFFAAHGGVPFSRIPLHAGERDQATGFVLRSDLLLAQARGETQRPLGDFRRELRAVPQTTSLFSAFEQLLDTRSHMMLVVDEYGGMEGIVTLEDTLETLLGLEIVDEEDPTADMQQLARRLWRRRARQMGLEVGEEEGAGVDPSRRILWNPSLAINIRIRFHSRAMPPVA
jgi:CBS domain containing-hemolysin-like protein